MPKVVVSITIERDNHEQFVSRYYEADYTVAEGIDSVSINSIGDVVAQTIRNDVEEGQSLAYLPECVSTEGGATRFKYVEDTTDALGLGHAKKRRRGQ